MHLLFGFLIIWMGLSACSGSDEAREPIVSSPADNEDDEAVPPPERCANAPGSPGELASTPRERRDIEQLARILDGSFVARDETYARLRSDIDAFRAMEPEIEAVAIVGALPTGLLLYAEEAAFERLQAGDDPYFECLTQRYPSRIAFDELKALDIRLLSVDFDGVYALETLLPAFARVDGVRAEINLVSRVSAGAASLRIVRDDTHWTYVFPAQGARCGSSDNCHEQTVYEFVSESDGQRMRSAVSAPECICD